MGTITLTTAPAPTAGTGKEAEAQLADLRTGRGSNRGSIERAMVMLVAMLNALKHVGKAVEVPVAMFATGTTPPAYVLHNALKGRGTRAMYEEYGFKVVMLKNPKENGKSITGTPDYGSRTGRLFILIPAAE